MDKRIALTYAINLAKEESTRYLRKKKQAKNPLDLAFWDKLFEESIEIQIALEGLLEEPVSKE